jgi:hypothetical protein
MDEQAQQVDSNEQNPVAVADDQQVFLADRAIAQVANALMASGVDPAAVAAAMSHNSGVVVGLYGAKEEIDEEFFQIAAEKFRKSVEIGMASAAERELALMPAAGSA